MNDDRKTLVINTVNETAYRKAAAAGKISDKELYIVDDDTRGRTVVASYDIVNLKQRQAVLSSAARLSLAGDEIVLTQGGRRAGSVDVGPFLKDAVLSAVEVRLEDEKLKFKFTVKDAATSSQVDVIEAECAFPVDDGLSADSRNPVEASAIYAKFNEQTGAVEEVRQELYGLSGQVSSFTEGWKSEVDGGLSALSAEDESIWLSVQGLSDKVSSFTNTWKSEVDDGLSALSAEDESIWLSVGELSDKVSSFTNDWKAGVDVSVDNLAGAVDGLRPAFFNASDYGFEDKFEVQSVDSHDLVVGVIDAFREGRNVVVRFGGYQFLVNAVMDKSQAGISGFCGVAVTAKASLYDIGKPDQIRAMFHTWHSYTFFRPQLENDAVDELSARLSAVYGQVSSFTEGWKTEVDEGLSALSAEDESIRLSVGELSGQVSSFTNKWKAGVDLSVDKLSPAFFDIADFGFRNEFRDQAAPSNGKIGEVVEAFNQGRNVLIRFGGYNVLVNAILDQTQLGGISGFCGTVITKRQAEPDLSAVDQIRAMFYDFTDGDARLEIRREDDAVYDLSGEVGRLSGEVGDLSAYVGTFKDWQNEVNLSLDGLSGYVQGLSDKVSSFTNTWKSEVDGGLSALSAEDLRIWLSVVALSGQVSSFTNKWKADVDLSVDGLSGKVASLEQAVYTDIPSTYLSLALVTDAPSDGNKVVTQGYLSDELRKFDNVMHFRGVVSCDPNECLSDALSDYQAGDVVVCLSSGLEWVLALSGGVKEWQEFGDQENHASKAYIEAGLEDLSGKITGWAGETFQLSGDYLSAEGGVSFEYVPSTDQIVLSVGKNAAMSIDCAGFAKDGRVSAVALSGHELVLSFSESRVEALSALSSLSVSLDDLVVKDYVHVAGEENVGPLGLSGDLSVSGTLYVNDGGELPSLEEFVDKRTGGVKEAIRNSLGLLAEDPLATLNQDSKFEDVVSALVDIRDTLLALSAALSA